MLLEPSYGDPPILAIDLPPCGAVHPMVAQRRRLAARLAELSEEEWRHPSRCQGWTSQDVITHLTSTNQFWEVSIRSGLAGEPTRYLATFDPVASPAQLVADTGAVPVTDTLAAFTESSDVLCRTVEGLSDADLACTAEAPPGHLPVRQVADHALWDAWVHERDVLLPLDDPPPAEPDEVRTSLRYVAALGLAFRLGGAEVAAGSASIRVADPDDQFVVALGSDAALVHGGEPPADARPVEGPAVDLLEMLSIRDVGRAVPADVAWLGEGLAAIFDQSG